MKHHIKIEFFEASFKEQMLYHLDKEEEEAIKKLFEAGDASGIREFVEERSEDVDAWWYDDPIELQMSIEVDEEEYGYGPAGDFVNEDTMISTLSQCPNISYMGYVCEEAGEDMEDYHEGNEILFIEPGNRIAQQMLEDAVIWDSIAENCEKEILENEELEFEDYMYSVEPTSHMCLFDAFLKQYGMDQQLVLIESLRGECNRQIEFDIEEEFDPEELRFIYDSIQNPDAAADEQIMMDRLVYGNRLYGEDGRYKCVYHKDKFVLASINKHYPGWLHYIAEIEL